MRCRIFSGSTPKWAASFVPTVCGERAITLTALATQSVDQTAEAIGIDAQTARRYYLDAKQAFDGTDLLKRMTSVLKRGKTPKKGRNKS
jgi:hypothetical protein